MPSGKPAGKPVKMTLPDGKVVDGVEVDIDETLERWTEVKLADGTVVRVKLTVLTAQRAVRDYDPQGQPWYTLNMAPVVAVVSIPDKFMKPKGKA
jgi:hypothetical protein